MSAPADGPAVSGIEQLVAALSKENFNGFRTTEFYVVILTWLLPLATLIWHRDFSSLAVPLSTLAAGIANAAYAISRAMTKSGRARAVATLTANPAAAVAGGAAEAVRLAADIQALRTALDKLPQDAPRSLGVSAGTRIEGAQRSWEEGDRPAETFVDRSLGRVRTEVHWQQPRRVR